MPRLPLQPTRACYDEVCQSNGLTKLSGSAMPAASRAKHSPILANRNSCPSGLIRLLPLCSHGAHKVEWKSCLMLPALAHPTPAQRPVPIMGPAFLILMQQQCAATDSFAKPPAELPECAAGGSRGNLGVDLHRDGDLAVPKDLHGHPGMHVKAPAGPLAPPTRRARLRSRYGGTEPVGWREKRKALDRGRPGSSRAAAGFDKGTLAMAQIGLTGQARSPPDRQTAYGPSPLAKSRRCVCWRPSMPSLLFHQGQL